MESFPFTSHKNPDGSYDRASDSLALRRVFSRLFSNGISRDTAEDLMVSSAGGMTLTIKGGGGIINGVIFNMPHDETVQLSAANATYPRIDNIVVRHSDDSRDVALKVLEGAPASSPKAPPLIRNSMTYDLCLAQILVPQGAAAVTNGHITDTRLNNALCGLMSPNPYPADTTAYYNQIQASLGEQTEQWGNTFNAWFNDVKNILDANTAGNLYNAIQAIPQIIVQEGDAVPPVVEGALLIRV